MASVVKKLETTQEQRELFLWKFSDVSREEVNSLMKVGFVGKILVTHP